MATSVEYIEFVCEQLRGIGPLRYKKMFGEYMVYVNDKPVLLVCDDTVYVKKHPSLTEKMNQSESGVPYNGAKEHWILDVEDTPLSKEVIEILEAVTPIPKPRKKTQKSVEGKADPLFKS
ncbi:MAG: TfoX/Sxy family protein [Cellulosilyticaceae bacterium]